MPASGATRASKAGGRLRPAGLGPAAPLDTSNSRPPPLRAERPTPRAISGDVTSAPPGVTMRGMRRLLPPRQTIWLLIAGLLCLMAAGVASMSKFGPPRGHVYAAVQQNH